MPTVPKRFRNRVEVLLIDPQVCVKIKQELEKLGLSFQMASRYPFFWLGILFESAEHRDKFIDQTRDVQQADGEWDMDGLEVEIPGTDLELLCEWLKRLNR